MSKINPQIPRPATTTTQTPEPPVAQTAAPAQAAPAPEAPEAPPEAPAPALPGAQDQFTATAQSAVAPGGRPVLNPGQPAQGQAATQLSPLVSQDPRASLAAQSTPAATTQSPAAAPTSQASPSLAAMQPGGSLLERRLQGSTGRTGGTGALGLNDPNVAVARRHSSEIANQRIDWAHPEQAIDNMSQIDSNRAANNHVDGDDAIRCGAASLLAGATLQGREGFQDGLLNINERNAALIDRYRSLETIQMPNGRRVSTSTAEGRRMRDGIVSQLNGAYDAIENYANNPGDMTYGDMQGLQQAVYEVAVLDQRLSRDHTTYVGSDENASSGGGGTLRTGTMRTYRDLAWSGNRPQMGGQELEMFWVDNEASGGHYVLANNQSREGGRAVAFNPWPESDGSAFSRAHDGQGVSVVPENTTNRGQDLRGIDIDNDGTALPSRD